MKLCLSQRFDIGRNSKGPRSSSKQKRGLSSKAGWELSCKLALRSRILVIDEAVADRWGLLAAHAGEEDLLRDY